MLYQSLRCLFRFLLILWGSWKVKGKENIPASGPFLVVSNHLSYWDPILVGNAINRQLHFMAKAELFSVPLLKHVMKNVGSFPIKRGRSDLTALRTALKILKEGRVICVFPEGTRNKKTGLLPFKAGVTMIAFKAQCPILPVAVKNSPKTLLGWFYPVEVRIGEPIDFSNHDERPNDEMLEKLTEKIRQQIFELIESA